MKKRVAIIFGGRSPEHEISILSAKNVIAALDRSLFDLLPIGISKEGTWYEFSSEKEIGELKALSDSKLPPSLESIALIMNGGKPQIYSLSTQKSQSIDVAFPVMHGPFSEDGTIQGYLKLMNVPFVGCGVFSSAASIDKEIMKRIFQAAGIPTAKYVLLTPQNSLDFESLSKKLGAPFFIKPACQGSSVGVHKIKTKSDWEKGIKDAFLYDHRVLAEEYIEGREIECSVLGHNLEPQASVAGEIIPTHEFYSYEAKYLDENGAALKIPADLSTETLRKIQDIAKKTFTAMGCEGMARIDFFLKRNGDPVVNELNTIPGFTKISMYPKMWEASGLKYSVLITKLIQLSLENFARENSLLTNFQDLKS